MTIDPSDYDLGELQNGGNRGQETNESAPPGTADRHPSQNEPSDSPLSDGMEWGRHPQGPDDRLTIEQPPAEETPTDRSIGRELARLQRSVSATRPYLAELPDSYDAEQTIIDWLDPLVAAAGIQGALDALAYYESVGWISTATEKQLQEYVRLVADPDLGARTRQADMHHHRRSLTYIARLAARR